jgi:hypothetical protein
MELEEVVRCRETDSPQQQFRRLVAVIITQAYSDMVRSGLEYGCVCTGEAYIFLRVPDDPKTVYYFLSVPKGDAGETTGWAPDPDGGNRLHLTAVGQVLAFTRRALKTPPRGQTWRTRTIAQLKSWEVVYDDLLDTVPVHQRSQSSQHNATDRSVGLVALLWDSWYRWLYGSVATFQGTVHTMASKTF